MVVKKKKKKIRHARRMVYQMRWNIDYLLLDLNQGPSNCQTDALGNEDFISSTWILCYPGAYPGVLLRVGKTRNISPISWILIKKSVASICQNLQNFQKIVLLRVGESPTSPTPVYATGATSVSMVGIHVEHPSGNQKVCFKSSWSRICIFDFSTTRLHHAGKINLLSPSVK